MGEYGSLVAHLLANYRKNLAEGELLLVAGPPCHVFRIKKPGTGINSVTVANLPDGVSISGDLAPNDNRVVLAYGYKLPWFVGDLSSGYLAGKFLQREWVPESASDCLRDWAREEAAGEDCDQTIVEVLEECVLKVRDGIKHGRSPQDTQEDLYDTLQIYGYGDDGVPGWTYTPRDLALLQAIQERFRELFWAKYELIEPDGALIPREV